MGIKFEIKDGKITATEDGDNSRAPLPYIPPDVAQRLPGRVRDVLCTALTRESFEDTLWPLMLALLTLADATGLPLTRIAATFEQFADIASSRDPAQTQATAKAYIGAAWDYREQVSKVAEDAMRAQAREEERKP